MALHLPPPLEPSSSGSFSPPPTQPLKEFMSCLKKYLCMEYLDE
jgi:hypothetical protein